MMNFSMWLPPLLIAAAGTGGVFAMALNLRKARTIEDTPTAKIRSAAQGYAALHGFARAIGDEPLRAPLTGKACVWYRYTIERYERGAKNSRWNTIERGCSEQLFGLDDRTGLCHIDPRRAEVTAEIEQRWEGDTRHPNGMATNGVLDNLFGQRYRYTEYRIHPDEWIYVLGWFETLHGPSLPERAAAQTKLLLNQWKQDRDRLLARFDSNSDGEIDLREWEATRSVAAQQAATIVMQQPAPAPINTVSLPPLRDRPFLIASKDPRALAHRYRRNAMISLLIGIGVAGYVLWNFYYRLR